MTYYNLIYLLSNIFGTYTIYRFMHIFFGPREKSKKVELTSYVLYFLVIGIVYITFNIPIVNLVSNLIMFFLLTLNYDSTWTVRLNAVVYIYAILISVETITIVILNILELNTFVEGD